MDKSPMEKLDKSESSRIDALKHSKDGADPISCFRSDIVQAVIRAGSQAFVEGFASPILPNTIPFGDRTFVEICPTCTCVKSPNLLLPYLERDLVVPVLDSEYKGYSPHFIDEVLRYPHISAYEFYGIRNIALRNKNRTASDAEIAAIKRSCFKANEKNSVVRESRLDTIVSNLEPYYLEDLPFLLNVLQNLQKKQRKLLDLQMYLSHLVAAFRCSEAFSFTPQVTLDDLSILGWIPQEHKGVHFDLADVRETIMNGLKISYDSSIPLETYLDIVSERKTKIREIVRKIMKEANPQNIKAPMAKFESHWNLPIRSCRKNHRIIRLKFEVEFLGSPFMGKTMTLQNYQHLCLGQ